MNKKKLKKWRKELISEITGHLQSHSDRLEDMERKLSREQDFEEWKARSSIGGGQFGFSYTPCVDNYPQNQ